MRTLKFSHKIMLAASLVVIAAFASFALYNDYLQRTAIRESLSNYLNDVGLVSTGNIQHWLDGRMQLLDNLAESVQDDSSPASLRRSLQHRSIASAFLYAYFGQADGSYTQFPASELPAGYDPRQRPWYKSAQGNGGPGLTAPYLAADPRDGLLITITRPVSAGGNLLGVVGGDLKLQTVDDILNSFDLGGMGYAFLVDEKGTVLVHPDKSLVLKTLTELFPGGAPRLESTLQSASAVDGSARLVTFLPVQGLAGVRWYVGLSVDEGKAFAALSEFRVSALMVTIIGVVAILLLLGALIRILLRPLHVMSHAMGGIAEGEGDLTQRLTIASGDEFGELAGAFNRFVERIHESIREVASATREVHARVSTVVQASNASMDNSSEQASRTDSVAAASEVVSVAIDALRAAGVTNISIDFTLPDLVDTLVATSLPLDADKRAAVRRELDTKDAGGLREAGGDAYLPLLYATGDFATAIDKLAALDAGGALASRIEGLRTIAATIGERARVTLDPTERHGFEYQSWFGFTLYGEGARGALGRGGTYTIKGSNESATGFSLYMDPLLDALGGPEADTRDRVFLPLGHDRDVAARLRAVGWRTVAAVSDGDDAAALGCSHRLDGAEPRPL